MPHAYGASPEPHEVVHDTEARQIVIRNPYYEVAHSLDRGGAICAVRLVKVGPDSLLLAPCGMELSLEGSARPFAPGAETTVEQSGAGHEVRLSFEGPLQDPEGNRCGVTLRTTYLHRWGHVKVHQELRVPSDGMAVTRLLLHSWRLAPQLSSFGVRPGASAEASSYPGAFGVCQWGRFSPGNAFDCAHESRHVPRYVCFAEAGRRGLEWFVGSLLSQWDYQLVGEPGHGSLHIAPGTDLRPWG